MRNSKLWQIAAVVGGAILSAPATAAPGTFQTVYTFGTVANDGVAP